MPTLSPARPAAIAVWNYFFEHRALIDYSETRPTLPEENTYPQLQATLASGRRIRFDCAGCCTTVARDANWADPNHLNFDGEGYTGTELEYLDHIPTTATQLGDYGVFGEYPGKHIVQFATIDPTDFNQSMVWSMGKEGDPRCVTLADEWLSHPGEPLIILSATKLLPVEKPTPSYHYTWYDNGIKQLANDKNSERAVVENYDAARKHPLANAVKLRRMRANLKVLLADLQRQIAEESPAVQMKNRVAWRASMVQKRANGNVVNPT